jgi:putative membrane protein
MRKIRLASVILFLLASSVYAHEGEPHQPADLWRSWSFDPLIVISLIMLAAVYVTGIFRLWKRSGVGKGITGWQAAAFIGAWSSLVIALVSPLHPWGEVLFSAHMTQHEILMLVSAPLLVLSRPFIATMWSMPTTLRQSTGAIIKSEPIDSLWYVLTNPLTAWAVHAGALWIWHLPYLFQATLKSDFVHTLQHISFFGSALLFWWAIIATPHSVQTYGAGVLYLFTTSVHSGILGAFLTFGRTVLYPTYSESTAEWGLTPLEDQQLGGLIMWVPAGIVYIIAALIMFAGWLAESEKGVLRRERERWAGAE